MGSPFESFSRDRRGLYGDPLARVWLGLHRQRASWPKAAEAPAKDGAEPLFWFAMQSGSSLSRGGK
jgi:hypothetical protein